MADPLSDAIRVSSARTVLSTGLRATGRWAIAVTIDENFKFNAVTEGTCWITVGDAEPVALKQGDCFFLRGPVTFVLASDLKADVQSATEVFANAADGFATLNKGTEPRVTCIGGKVLSAEGFEFLSDALPNLITIRGGTRAADNTRWLLDRLISELATNSPGTEIMCEQIMQMIFVEMIRMSLEEGLVEAGWLSALADPRISPAVRLLHLDPKRDWRLPELASACNLSRSQFASRFTDTVGMSPIAYLVNWRMFLARKALQDPKATLARVASEAGYQSEAAFGAAFKRAFGTSPRRYFRSRQAVVWAA